MIDEMYEETVAFEGMWPFPTQFVSHELRDTLEDGLQYGDLPEILKQLHIWDGMNQVDSLVDEAYFKGISGYVGVATTPIMKCLNENSSSFSWGHRYTRILFGETSEDLIAQGVMWARECREKEKREYRNSLQGVQSSNE